MPKDNIFLNSFDGVSQVTSKEDLIVQVLQELRNLRHARKPGRAIKRDPYTNVLTAGLTALNSMIELQNKNGDNVLLIADGDTLERSINTAGSYAAIAAMDNDDRTAGSTLDGDDFNPIIVNKEIHSGSGINAATDRPFWYGYIPARNRFNSGTTLTAGRYLDQQDYRDIYDVTSSFLFYADIDEFTIDKTGAGLDTGTYTVYIAPVYDGYQRGFPTKNVTFVGGFFTSFHSKRILNSARSLDITFTWDGTATDAKRITGFDLFVAFADDAIGGDPDSTPAYFLERIDINDDSDTILDITGNTNSPANKITITNSVDWFSFNPVGLFVHDVAQNTYHRVTSQTLSGSDRELTVTPNSTNSATGAQLRIVSRWYTDSGNQIYATFFDNELKKLGSEMYAYLGIPSGDEGITDFRYRYSAWNGDRLMIGGMPSPDGNFTYFSTTNHPDIIPAQNIIRHTFEVKGIAAIGQDFFVFGEHETDRIRIVDNTNAFQDDTFANVGCVSQKAIVKINDDNLLVMTYNGPYMISNRSVVPVGEHLQDWWDTLTNAQKEACVGGYNHLKEEAWFSFPTYTDSTYTAGVIMVFDINGFRRQMLSPWWFAQTDVALKAFTINSEKVMLGGAATKIVDLDTAGTDESVATGYKMKMLQSPLPNTKVRWNRLYVDCETSDTVSANLYFDGSPTAVSLSLNTDLKGMIRYLKKTLEVEILTSASTNSVEHKGLWLDFHYKRAY